MPRETRYFFKSPLVRCVFAAIDKVSGVVLGRPNPPALHPAAVRSILLCNGAHLGDLVMASAILPEIRRRFPEASIGLLTASWSRTVLDGHALIRWFHTVDHWKLNRAPLSRWRKFLQYARSRRQALQEIRARRYDVAIDLYYYFPNSCVLLYQAGIPIRIGYTSGGFGAFLTHAVPWIDRRQHIAQYQMDLLDTVLPEGGETRALAYALPDPPCSAALESLLNSSGLDEKKFLLIHMGSGNRLKEWPREKWAQLVARIAAEGVPIALTGFNPREAADVRWVAAQGTGVVDLAGRLDWPGFVAVIRRARGMMTIDSVGGHLAAAVQTPVIVIFAGVNDPTHCAPLTTRCRVLYQPVSCFPCHRPHGCPPMTCIREVEVEAAYDAFRTLWRNDEQLLCQGR